MAQKTRSVGHGDLLGKRLKKWNGTFKDDQWLADFWTEVWIPHRLKVKQGVGWWFFIEKKGHVGEGYE